MMPALFTSTSTGPNSSSSAVKSASAVSGSDTSPWSAFARPPALVISSTTASAASESLR